MSFLLEPRKEILPVPQQLLWAEMIDVPEGFVLYGGTAVALHLGHRQSIDFDFFIRGPFDPDDLLQSIPFLDRARVLQKSVNTLTTLVDRGGPVQVSFFGVLKLGCLSPSLIIQENNLRIASLVDLAGTKAAVVQKRAEAKDYIDIDALMTQGGIDLPQALAAGQYLYGPTFNPEITLKALSYFEDGNVHTIPQDMRQRLARAVQDVDLDALPTLLPDTKTTTEGNK